MINKKKKIVELSGDFHQQFLDIINGLNPNSHIVALWIRSHYSLWDDVGINYRDKKIFYPQQATPVNIFTKGVQFNKFAKLFNHLYDNCKYIDAVKISLIKQKKYKYSTNYFLNTDKEYQHVNYIIVIDADGITPEALKKEEEQKEQLRLEQLQREEWHKKRIEHIAYYKDLNKDEIYDDLGYSNSWHTKDDEPDIVKTADADPDHYYDVTTEGHCLTRYTSHKYKFYFDIDSSD